MKIEPLYFTVEQLAEHWKLSIADIMQLGLTNQLEFVAQADCEYPDFAIIQRGAHVQVSFERLANIYHATEPFCETGICQTSEDASLIGANVTITFYPGTEHLIIDACEVERFELENQFDNHRQSLMQTERSTLLKLIIGMAIDAYGFNPNSNRNAATGDKNGISAKLATYGINIDADTIRKYLNEAKELL